VPELVDEQLGVLAERADPALFAQAVRDLYDRDIEQLGRAARQRVLTRFTWQQAMQLQMAAYAGLANAKSAAAARPAPSPEIVAAAID
jgi:glycosyltransferase involved in cell wall biosynthesis